MRNRDTLLDKWLNEFIMCGWPWPIKRKQALNEMMAEGWTMQEAIECLCWYPRCQHAKP